MRLKDLLEFQAYSEEITKAKDEFYLAIGPFREALENAKKRAWEKYIERIIEANKFLKED